MGASFPLSVLLIRLIFYQLVADGPGVRHLSGPRLSTIRIKSVCIILLFFLALIFCFPLIYFE